jgi:farnesyl diphosphate synthase/geranylgeranyl diphosphate synthase type II
MIAGQGIDIGMDGPVTTLDALVRLHRAKTGALLRAAVAMGGVCAGADADALAALDRYGDALGLAFQVHDDVLDADQDDDPSGPPSFVRLLGVEATAAAARRYADTALGALEGFRAPDALAALARYTVERDH